MTWLILVQALLLALLAGAFSQAGASHVTDMKWFKGVVCVIGALSVLFIGIGIYAAQRAIRILKKKYEETYGGANHVPRNLPPIAGGDDVHLLGKVPFALPFLCIAVWAAVGYYIQ
jgi:hypothetical protein